MSTKQTATLSLRLPRELRSELEQIAEKESNCVNAVARRLLASGVARAKQAIAEAKEAA